MAYFSVCECTIVGGVRDPIALMLVTGSTEVNVVFFLQNSSSCTPPCTRFDKYAYIAGCMEKWTRASAAREKKSQTHA